MSEAKQPPLLPCPFCGSEAEIERCGDRRMSTIYQCTSCSCRLETGEEWGHGRKWNTRAASLHHELVAVLEPFVAMRDQSVRETVKVINKGMDGLTPISVTVTKDTSSRQHGTPSRKRSRETSSERRHQ